MFVAILTRQVNRQGPIRTAYKGVSLVSSPECLQNSQWTVEGT